MVAVAVEDVHDELRVAVGRFEVDVPDRALQDAHNAARSKRPEGLAGEG
jgi:hypothetical protein